MSLEAITFVLTPGSFPSQLSFVLVRDDAFIPETISFIRAFAPSATFLGYVSPWVSAGEVDEQVSFLVSSDRWQTVVDRLLQHDVAPRRIVVLLSPGCDDTGYLKLGQACLDHVREVADRNVPLARKVPWLKDYLRTTALCGFEGDRPLWLPECYFHPYRDLVKASLGSIDAVMSRLADKESRDALQLVLYGSPEDYLQSFLCRAFYHQQYTDLILLHPGDNIVNAGVCSGWDVSYFQALTGGLGRHILVDPCHIPAQYCAPPFEPLYAALWDKEDTLTFEVNAHDMIASGVPVDHVNGKPTKKVKCLALDRIVEDASLGRIDLIKMDIEGGEPRALAGMRNTLVAFRPQVALAIYHQPEQMWTLPAALMELLPRYRFYIRHYGPCRFECILYAIPEERFPDPKRKQPHQQYLEAQLGVDAGLEEASWNRTVLKRSIREKINADARAGWEPAHVAERVARELEKGFLKLPTRPLALPTEVHPGAADLTGSGWGGPGSNRIGQTWRWIGKGGSSSLFLHLEPVHDVSCRVYLQDAASEAAISGLGLEANGNACPLTGRSHDGEGLSLSYSIPARSLQRNEGRCRLTLKTLAGEKQACVHKLVLARAENKAVTPVAAPIDVAPPAEARHVERLLNDVESTLVSEGDFARFFTGLTSRNLVRLHKRIFWGDRLLTFEKSAGFLDDPTFAAAYQHIRGSHIYDAYDSPHTISWRLHTLVWAAQRALGLPGDFVECGVFKGDMAWVVTQMVDFTRLPRTFYLYDTFAGFSAAYSSGADFPDHPGFLDFAQKVYSDPSVYEEVKTKFAAMPNVRIIRGVVPDSFAAALPERIAYLHIDLNSPAAEVAALEALFDRVTPGGAIVFDDYGWHQFRKQKEAEDQFLAARGYRVLELPTGQGLVVK